MDPTNTKDQLNSDPSYLAECELVHHPNEAAFNQADSPKDDTIHESDNRSNSPSIDHVTDGEGYVDDIALSIPNHHHHLVDDDDYDRSTSQANDPPDITNDESHSLHVTFADQATYHTIPLYQSTNQSIIQLINKYFPYIILTLAILSISCAGTLLKLLSDTPPLLKAFWRLFFMSVVLSAGFAYQWKTLGNQPVEHSSSQSVNQLSNQPRLLTIKQKFWLRETWIVFMISGMSCSAHFGFWISSLNYTSLAHSLFFVSTYPIVCVVWMLVRRHRLDRLECVGVAVGLIGATLLISDTARAEQEVQSNEQSISPSIFGDVLAFLGSVVFVVYLYAGQRARSWLPLFMYAAPMTLISSIPLLLLSLIVEDVSFAGLTAKSVFGFLAPSSLWILVLIAIGPGGFGHTGVNYCVAHLSPLVISVTMTLEPVLGVIVGLLAGVEAQPHALTLVGGPISVCGTILAIYGTHQREQREKAAGPAYHLRGVSDDSDELLEDRSLSIADDHECNALIEEDSDMSTVSSQANTVHLQGKTSVS